jgi:putative tricarboxylic transport membrane protein
MVTPIARLTAEALVIVVPAESKIQSAKELVDAMKADISKVTFAGGSAGGVDHILAGLLAGTVGLDGSKVNYVPFAGGGEALAALLSGRVTAGISGWGEFEGQIKAGKLRAIAVTSGAKLPGNPTPTLKDQGIALEVINWRSVVAAPAFRLIRRRRSRTPSTRWSSPRNGRTCSSSAAGTTPIWPSRPSVSSSRPSRFASKAC